MCPIFRNWESSIPLYPRVRHLSTLLWEVLTYNELEKFYQAQIRALPVKTPPLDELLELLIRRKLVVKGVGYTGRDALYNMLSDAFVVPFRHGGSKRLWSL